MTSEFDELSDADWDALAQWAEEHVGVDIAAVVDPNDVDVGIHDPDRLRSLANPAERDRLDLGQRLSLDSLITTWRSWTDAEKAPDGIVTWTRLGTSPWRERRAETPPIVPPGRGLVWMEWIGGYGDHAPLHPLYHRAEPDWPVPVTEGAAGAVLTTPARARSFGSRPCTDCFPEEADDGSLMSVVDTVTGERVIYDVDCIGEFPEGVSQHVRTVGDAFEDDGQVE